MRIKVNFEIPVPTFGLPKLFKHGKRLLPKGNVDKVSRSVVESPLEIQAVDRIEYETPLNSPHANQSNEIFQAVDLFLHRNQVDCPVGLVVSPDNALVRSVRLPPVEHRKVGDIMAWEAKHQIPFEQEDVEWDWVEVSSEMEEGYVLDLECIMVARKAANIQSDLAPFLRKGLKRRVDLVQVGSLTLADYLWNFHLASKGGIPVNPYGDEPVQYVVALDMGAQTTKMVVTAGAQLWSREIPIGGSLFTKALCQAYHLTFDDAERRKVVIKGTGDEVYTAFDGVVTDLIGEVTRSLGFFQSLYKNSTIFEVAFFGGGFKLPGLKEQLLSAVQLSELILPYLGGIAPETVMDLRMVKEHGESMHQALVVAMQRLGVGRYRVNLFPEGHTFGTKTRAAWGIDIGTHALTAVRVGRKPHAA